MSDVIIPAQGVAMTEAILVRWLKQPGQEVATGEPVAEIETDKSTMELEAPATGRLGPHLAAEGDTVPVGATVVRILGPDETGSDPAAAVDSASVPPTASPAEAPVDGSAVAPDPELAPEPDSNPPHRLSPRARRALAQQTVAAQPATVELPAPPGVRGRHRTLIAAKITESWQTIPHFTVTREVDATALLVAKTRLRDTISTLSVTDLLLRALAATYAAPVDLGLAVASEQGVMVPVIANVRALDVRQLVAARQAAVDRGRTGRLSSEDRGEPASTLSNLGPFGVDSFTGIIATGQPSLLTVGRIARRVIATDTGPTVRPTFYATLNADHRKLDGADAAELLMAFVHAVEAGIPVDRQGGQSA